MTKKLLLEQGFATLRHMDNFDQKPKRKSRGRPRKNQEAPEEPNKGGRPPTYDASFVPIARQLCALGATDADLATAFSVTTQSIWLWQKRHPDFKDAVRQGKADVFDPMVERSLAQRAIGYAVDTEEVKVLANGDVVRYQMRKHYPPDPTSCIFWLKNRQPEKWRDVYDHNHNKTDENLTAAQLREQIIQEAVELGLVPEQFVAPKNGVDPQQETNAKNKSKLN